MLNRRANGARGTFPTYRLGGAESTAELIRFHISFKFPTSCSKCLGAFTVTFGGAAGVLILALAGSVVGRVLAFTIGAVVGFVYGIVDAVLLHTSAVIVAGTWPPTTYGGKR